MASDTGPVFAPLDSDTVRSIHELVMLAKDAGVSKFTCALFAVEFPPPAPVIEQRIVQVVPMQDRGVVGDKAEEPKDNLSLLFPGGKPKLLRGAE